MNWLWTRDGDYALKCGDYRVAKTTHTSGEWQYAAYYRKEFLGVAWSADLAKEACMNHARESKA